jgi:tRNA 2-(methylsulfanyl)-N6-isopentenyladenosine37 hydroxylase
MAGAGILRAATPPGWFEVAAAGLPSLLSDHLHCERKAAENALSLVRRYPSDPQAALQLGRLAHEETSHVIQVAELMQSRGYAPRADSPNRYARALLAEARPREPGHHLDALLVAAFIEARSHERLELLERGFAARGDHELSRFYRTLATAEDRHAEIFLELAARVAPAGEVASRLAELGAREAEIIAGLPFSSRVH